MFSLFSLSKILRQIDGKYFEALTLLASALYLKSNGLGRTGGFSVDFPWSWYKMKTSDVLLLIFN